MRLQLTSAAYCYVLKTTNKVFYILNVVSVRFIVTFISKFKCLERYFAEHYPFTFKQGITPCTAYGRMSFHSIYTQRIYQHLTISTSQYLQSLQTRSCSQ